MTASTYSVTYAPDRAQYCVAGPRGLRVYPMPQVRDPDAHKRAVALAVVLNRMERETPRGTTWHESVEGSPEDAPDDETQARVYGAQVAEDAEL